MKNGIYLLLGLMVIIRSNGLNDDESAYCKYNDEEKTTAKCYHRADIEPYNPKLYTPIDNLSTSITDLTLQTTYAPKLKWYINNLDYFTRFDNLLELQIFGPLSFSKDLNLKLLKKLLFNVSTLKTLFLFHNGFNSNDQSWTLPTNLKNLTVVGNDYTEFSVKENPYLENISFHLTSLASMPEFSNPPPPLKVVDFRNNPLLEITVDAIALFCQVKTLSLDANNLQKSDTYCECTRMKKWIKEVLKEPEENIFNKSLECFNTSTKNCQNYTLDNAFIIRDNCILSTLPLNLEDTSIHEASEGISNLRLYLIIGILVAVTSAILLITFVAFKYFYRAPPEKYEEGNQDDDKQDDDRYDDYEQEDIESVE